MYNFDNYLAVSYDDQDLNLPKSNPYQKLSLHFQKKIPLVTNNYYDALYHNARMIEACYPGPYDVLLSGGIDSEVVVRINNDLGIEQNVYVVKFEKDYNIRDVNSALDIGKELGIPITIIDSNLEKFIENDAELLYKKTFVSRVEELVRLGWHHYFDRPLLLGSGEPYYKRVFETDYSKKSEWLYYFVEYEFANSLLGRTNNQVVIGDWYNFTPDIKVHYHKLPIIKQLLDDQLIGKLSSYSSRVAIHQYLWPSIKLKPKLVGFEGPNSKPGEKPEFMQVFQDTVMQGVVETDTTFTALELEKKLCVQ